MHMILILRGGMVRAVFVHVGVNDIVSSQKIKPQKINLWARKTYLQSK